MIKISILNSNDIELIGEHLYHGNFLSVGTTTSDRVLIEPELHLPPFRLCFKTISDTRIAVHNLPIEEYILSNGKKISGTKLHKVNDIIDYNGLKIKIISFNHERREKKLEENKIEEIIQQLELEFIQFETR